MGFLLALFKRNFPDEVELDPEFEAYADKQIEDFEPMCAPTILDHSATVVQEFLNKARASKTKLEGAIVAENDQHAKCIRDLSEELRRTNVAIAAFEPVLPRLVDGYDANATAETESPDETAEVEVEAKPKRVHRHFRKPALQAAE